MWTCSKCGEESEDDFDVCWNCQTSKDAPLSANTVALGEQKIKARKPAPPIESSEAASLMTRYRDGYLKARVMNGWGQVIKGLGVMVAILLAILGMVLVNDDRSGDATFAFGVVIIVSGVISGIWFFILGIVIAAHGQMLKASLDGAVNSSPFLTNEQRAKIMSL